MPITPTKPKSSMIVIGSYEGVISGYSFDLETKIFAQSFGYQAHIGAVRSISISGRHLATGGSDELIHLFDTAQLREKGGLSCHSSSVTAMALGGSTLLSGSQEGIICVSEFKGNEWNTRLTINAHKDSVSSIALHPSHRMALSASSDGTLRMWDLMRGTCACVHNISNSSSVTVKSPPSQTVLSPSGKNFALLFPSKLQIGSFDSSNLVTLTGALSHILIISDSLILAGTAQGHLHLIKFDSTSASIAAIVTEEHTARVKGISLLNSTGSPTVCTVCTSGRVAVWQVDTVEISLVKISSVNSGIGRVTCMDATKN